MGLLDKLERKFGRYVPENLTKYLLAGQVVAFIMVYSRSDFAYYFSMSGRELLAGQVWRLLFVLFTPFSQSLIFVVFVWYFFYLFSTVLENQWGSFRYLVYLLISYLALIIFAFIFPDVPVTNSYIYISLFLAYAHLYPDIQLLLFFIIPVKVKWLGYLAWFGIIVSLIFGAPDVKLLTIFSISNYLIFFYNDLRFVFKPVLRGGSIAKAKALHICAVCGENEVDNPRMDIRYCSKCVPTTCYCGKHANNHQHKRMVN